jgi:hypothetical protein
VGRCAGGAGGGEEQRGDSHSIQRERLFVFRDGELGAWNFFDRDNCSDRWSDRICSGRAQREPEVEPDRLLDHLGWKPVPFVADVIPLASEPARPQARIAVTIPQEHRLTTQCPRRGACGGHETYLELPISAAPALLSLSEVHFSR